MSVLRTLLEIESNGGLLGAVWPPTPGDPCHSDPKSTDHSLPAEWFEGPEPLKLETRFDFRFRQLLRLIRISKMPTPIEFFIAARLHWMTLGGEFAKTALTFGERGLQTRHGASTRAFIVGLLEEVQTYYREIHAVDRNELEALRLLMAYTETPDRYRFDYERVLSERQALLTREIRVFMEGEGSAGWLGSALKVRDFLGVLVDPDRQTRTRDRALSRSGLSVQEYQCLVERRNEVLKQAEAALERDDYSACQDLLTPLLPSLNTTPWVQSEDLSAIDLWLRCARRTGRADPSTIAKVRSNLRRLALTYVRQFPAVVPDGQIQQLATQFVRTIEEAGETVPQAPLKG